MSDAEKLAKIFKALSVDKRLRLFMLLRKGPFCVNALAHKLEITPAAVSQHLRVLREADLVKPDKRGYFVHYTINEDKLKEYGGMIEELITPTDTEDETHCRKC